MIDQVKWDRRFLRLAQEISTFSKDPSTRVGAVIVNSLGQIVGSGYNGFPRGVLDTPERYLDRETKLRFIVHAELNAILLAGKEAFGADIYVYPTMGYPTSCSECSKAIIQSGIKRVISYRLHPEDRPASLRWKDSIEASRVMLEEAGVRISEVEP